MAVKTAIVGGTVNMGNYENFRFEFQGECSSSEDYLNLAAFAAGSLLGQAAGADEQTRTQIRSYVGRRFGLPDEAVPDVRKEASPAAEPAPASPPRPTTPAPKAAAPAPAPQKPAAPAKKPAYVCEDCGKDITATEQQMSTLFVNKALCRTCLNKFSGRGST